ncbi:MAG: FAD-dependent oxidoreductase [Janthinobacterium lividum]
MANAAAGSTITCDVLVIGAGAGGLSTAVTARKHGLNVIVIEKAKYFGGTAAFSGGILWVPNNHLNKGRGSQDSVEAARTYMKDQTGAHYNAAKVDAFLENGPRMLEFFERETEVKFVPTELFPDYHPDAPGGVKGAVAGAGGGRSVSALPFDARALGPEIKRLRPPLRTITFVGMMFNSANNELKHFFNATRSLTSAIYVLKRLGSHLFDLLRYRRGVQLTSGNALVARLAKSAFDLNIPLYTETPARELLRENGRVIGALVDGKDGPQRIIATHGVVLASGGFPGDPTRTAQVFPHVARGGRHATPAPEGNTGDGVRMAEAAGGAFEGGYPNAAAWIPVSEVPLGKGKIGVFPHLVDRYKPGIIAVNRHGKRFVNESNSYHDVGEAMLRTCAGETETAAWLVCDHRTIRKYGLGFAKPAPIPLSLYTSSGYLLKGNTLAELGRVAGIDPVALEQTVRQYNVGAAKGEDPEFQRGSTAFNRYLGDPAIKPNPNVGPIAKGPYYAVKIIMGDLGTFDGIKTDPHGRVLDRAGQPVEGLFAVGNDSASIMGGNYPGAGITLGPILTYGYIVGRYLAGAEQLQQAANAERVAVSVAAPAPTDERQI